MGKVFVVGTVDRVVQELARDIVGDGPAMLEAALRQARDFGAPSVGQTKVKGLNGLTIPVTITATPGPHGIAVEISSMEGVFACHVQPAELNRMAEHHRLDPVAVWAQGVWDDMSAAVLGAYCTRAAKLFGEQARRSNGVFHR